MVAFHLDTWFVLVKSFFLLYRREKKSNGRILRAVPDYIKAFEIPLPAELGNRPVLDS
jgi:hypothetical protein